MAYPNVQMNMAMQARMHQFMCIYMVPIAMGVSMLVRMRFCQVEHQAEDYQECASEHPLASSAHAKDDAEQRANERCERKHGACSGCLK